VKQTSLDALEKIAPKVGTIRRKVYEAILLKGLQGMTDYEIETQLHLEGNTVRPIRGSLVADGFVIDSGTTRLNARNNQCVVWRSAEDGMML
jgi:transcription initiation factor IIE alpha subunit